jgi:methylmalonyl-CoA mutase N-terminal domain/subunit
VVRLRTRSVRRRVLRRSDTVDPFAGSYYVETLTDEIERRANTLIAKVDQLGGSLAAIPFITAEIDESAWSYQERYRTEQDIVVGVNRYVEEDARVEGTLRVDPQSDARLFRRRPPPSPQALPQDVQAPAPPLDPQQARDALTAVLDEVGAARHRPFSRDAGAAAQIT